MPKAECLIKSRILLVAKIFRQVLTGLNDCFCCFAGSTLRTREFSMGLGWVWEEWYT